MSVQKLTEAQRMPQRSYWQSVSLDGLHSIEACKSWFEPLCEGMTPYKAEILCDTETDREKKLRAFMRDDAGNQFKFERTLGGAKWTIKRSPAGRAALKEGR